ncbi:MAG: prepilin-type cleavage/methylation domain-containing protein [Sideroxydans sp.]|nr:prepilin-type cleavage/methylation domain-containing protein [Sideroxydans sp.]
MKMKMRKPGPIQVALFLLLGGLLLVSLLRAKTAVDIRRAQLLEGDFRNIAHVLHEYETRFGALPGDDPGVGIASSHLAHAMSCAPAASGKCMPGNGILDGNWNDLGTASESYLFWQHVRLAGLLEGATDPASANYPAKNSEGGMLGVTSGSHSPIVELHGAQVICSDHIKASLARQIDAALDDGNTVSGSVMTTKEGTTTGGHAMANDELVDGEHYLVCMGTGHTAAN